MRVFFKIVGVVLALLAGSSMAAFADVDAIAADMKAKELACRGQAPLTRKSADCIRSCANAARNVTNLTISPDARQISVDTCSKYHAAAGFTADAAATVPGERFDERLTDASAMGAYCVAAIDELGCPVEPSGPNWQQKNAACAHAKGCSMSCPKAEAKGKHWARSLKGCEESYAFVKEVLTSTK